jgi:hypothetical protein
VVRGGVARPVRTSRAAGIWSASRRGPRPGFVRVTAFDDKQPSRFRGCPGDDREVSFLAGQIPHRWVTFCPLVRSV